MGRLMVRVVYKSFFMDARLWEDHLHYKTYILVYNSTLQRIAHNGYCLNWVNFKEYSADLQPWHYTSSWRKGGWNYDKSQITWRHRFQKWQMLLITWNSNWIKNVKFFFHGRRFTRGIFREYLTMVPTEELPREYTLHPRLGDTLLVFVWPKMVSAMLGKEVRRFWVLYFGRRVESVRFYFTQPIYDNRFAEVSILFRSNANSNTWI